MHGLAPGLDLSFWAGTTLDQVCIGQHDVQLHFSLPPVSLRAQTSYQVTTRTGSATYESPPPGASHLVELLGRTVTRALDVGHGTLRIEFGQSIFIEVFDENPNYECYQIEHDGQLIVV